MNGRDHVNAQLRSQLRRLLASDSATIPEDLFRNTAVDVELSSRIMLSLLRFVLECLSDEGSDKPPAELLAVVDSLEQWLIRPSASIELLRTARAKADALSSKWEGNVFHEHEDALVFGPSPDLATLASLAARSPFDPVDLASAIRIARFEGRRSKQSLEARLRCDLGPWLQQQQQK